MPPSKSNWKQDQREPEEMLDEPETRQEPRHPADEPELPRDLPKSTAASGAHLTITVNDDPKLFRNFPAQLTKQIHDAKNELKKSEDEYKRAETEANQWRDLSGKISDEASRLKFIEPTLNHWMHAAKVAKTRVHELRADIQGLEVIHATLNPPPEPKKVPA